MGFCQIFEKLLSSKERHVNDWKVRDEGFEISKAWVSGERVMVVFVGRRAREVAFSKAAIEERVILGFLMVFFSIFLKFLGF